MIEFSVCIYPSMSRRGSYAIAIANKTDEAVVVGFASPSSIEKTKTDLLECFQTSNGWEHQPELDYHRLQVVKS